MEDHSLATGLGVQRSGYQLALFARRTFLGIPRRLRLLLDAWVLVLSGEQGLGAWRGLVLDALQQRFGSNQRTAEKVVSEADRLFRYLAARGVSVWSDVTSELLDDWFWAARPDRWGRLRLPSESTAKNRQWIAGAVLRVAAELGAPVDVGALVANRIPRRARQKPTRPLTDEEARLVEVFAVSGFIASARPLLVVFAFAGGNAAEIAAVRVGDVSLQDATISFRGTAARTNPLGGWGALTVARFFRHNPPSDETALLCVSGRTDELRAAHSVTVRLGEVLRDAGISGREGVSARSIRLTTARRVLEAEGVEAAARFLGSVSLDTAADALGHDWRCSDGR